MKNLKKIASVFMMLCMVISVMAVSNVSAATTLKSDTTLPFSVGVGKNYTFKITANGTNQKPVVTVANGNALEVAFKGKSGNNYYFTVTGIGQFGSTSGVYMALPGGTAIRCCIVTVGIVPASASGTTQISSDAAVYNGHHYKLFDTKGSWEKDEKYCESLGGHLAAVTSDDENDFLFQYIQSENCDSAYFGAVRQGNDWKWIDGETFSYSNWADGEPNNQGGVEYYGMFFYQYSDGTWNDGTGTDDYPFLCEWDK